MEWSRCPTSLCSVRALDWFRSMAVRKSQAVQVQPAIARWWFRFPAVRMRLGAALMLWANPGLVSAVWAQPVLPSPVLPSLVPSLVPRPIAPHVDGTGSVVLQTGDRFDITGGALSDNGQNLFHSFERFDLGVDQTAYFVAAPEIRNILGRVTGGKASYLNGHVQVGNGNANLLLINPAGILTGINSVIDLPGSFTATTADWLGFDGQWLNVLETGAFAPQDASLNGLGFSDSVSGTIVNEGRIRLGAGQQLRLVGGMVLNTGELIVPNGEITLLSLLGQQVIDVGSDGSISLGGALPGKAPLLTLQSVPELLAARSPHQASKITINAANEVQLLEQVIPAEPGVTITAGKLNVSAEQGGRVEVLGDRVGLLSADINATGTQGGGAVLIGGDYQGKGVLPNAQQTVVDTGSEISVDVEATGDAGRTIVWADDRTQFAGFISARGGSQGGDGGFVEVSGQQQLVFRGQADVTASRGMTGTLLLDPGTIRIVNGNGGANDAALGSGGILFGQGSPATTFTLSETTLEALTGNVILEAFDEIVIENLSDNVLALDSVESIIFNVQSDSSTSEQFTLTDGNDLIRTQGGDLGIVARRIDLGSITTHGGDIVLGSFLSAENPITDNISGSTNVTLMDDVTLASDGGAIRINGNVLGEALSPRSLSAIAGTGDIDMGRLGDAFSSNSTLQNLVLTGNNITLGEAKTEGSLTLLADGQLSLGFSPELNAGDGLLLSAQSLEVDAPKLTAGDSIVLLSQTDLTLNRFAEINSGANTTIEVQVGSLILENFNPTGAVAPGNITLTASENLAVTGSALAATGNLVLVAGEQAILQDAGLPLRLNATADIRIQGDAGLELGAYRNPDSAINAGGDLRLLSDGPIAIDAILTQGGSFIAEDMGGNPADLTANVANFIGRISASGDVTFGHYEGPSLRVEAGGSITGGDISIFAPNPNITGPEADLFQSTAMPSVFLTAGVDSLTVPENAPLAIAAGGTTVAATIMPSLPANIQVGNIDTGASESQNGPIRLVAPGNIVTGNLDTTYSDNVYSYIQVTAGGAFSGGDLNSSGGDISIQTQGAIQAGDIDTSGFSNLSAVTLRSEADSIQVSTIDTGSGGIEVEAAESFRALGSFTNTFNVFNNDPGLLDYLVSLGYDRTILETEGVATPLPQARVSLIARPSGVAPGKNYQAPISILSGDQGQTILDQTPEALGDPGRVLIVADSQRAFRSGAAFDENPLYKPADAGDQIEDFDPVTNNFDFTSTPGAALVYGTDAFPMGASGFAGSVTVGEGTDSSLYASLQDQFFDPPSSTVGSGSPSTPDAGTGNSTGTGVMISSGASAGTGSGVGTDAGTGAGTTGGTGGDGTSPGNGGATNLVIASRSATSAQRQGERRDAICESWNSGLHDTAEASLLSEDSDGLEPIPERPANEACDPVENKLVDSTTLLRGIAMPALPQDGILPRFSELESSELESSEIEPSETEDPGEVDAALSGGIQ